MEQKSVYNCLNCSVSFSSRKNKKFCSKNCYFLSKKKLIEKSCNICNSNFTISYRFRDKKTCSADCAKISTANSLTTKIVKQCESCNVDFKVIKSCEEKSKYCSSECFYKHKYKRESSFVFKQCESCGAEFEKRFIKRSVRFCSKSCATSSERNPMFGKIGTMTGKVAWNNGLTKSSDDRLYNAGRKISKTQKSLFEKCILSHVGEKNPMFGHTKDLHTPEQRERYSRAAVERILKGVSGYKTSHLTGIYDSKKCSKQVKFKSSWELAAMMWWDYCDDISSYDYEPQVVELPDGRRAIPDFRTNYTNGDTKIVEIKPTQIQKLKSVKEKLSLVKETLNNSGVEYELLGDREIKLMIKNLGEIFENEVKRHKDR